MPRQIWTRDELILALSVYFQLPFGCLNHTTKEVRELGHFTVSPDDYTIHLSSALRKYEKENYYETHFRSISGLKLTLPIEHLPNRDFLAWHRDLIYQSI